MELYEYEKEHLAALRGSLAECTVLLAKNGAFPLGRPGRIAAFGSGVRHTVKGGTGSGEVNSRFFITVEQGLKDAGFTVTTEKWLDDYDEVREKARKAWIKDVKAEAKKAGVNGFMNLMGLVMPEPEYDLPLEGEAGAAVYVLSRISGEGNDRRPVKGDLLLTDAEVRDILALNKKFERFMLVLNVGGPVDLSPVQEVGNILILSQLGAETGAVLADILLGKAFPSGRLATTWAAWEDRPAVGNFGRPYDTDYQEGIYVGYRYYDAAGVKPLYPFGFGLSYTEFALSGKAVAAEGTKISVHLRAENTGAYPGRETAEVYVSVPEGRLDQPRKVLAGFAKTPELMPGESADLTVSFELKDLASYDTARAAWILEKGDYAVLAGRDAERTKPLALLRLDGEAAVRQVKNLKGKPGFDDWKPEKAAREYSDSLPVIDISAAGIRTETVDYDAEDPVEDAVKRLSDEELALACIGGFDPKAGLLSVVGNAGKLVAGAAGETTSALKKAFFPPVSMADGPAGLRLSTQFYRDEKGAHTVGASGVPESILDFLPGPARKAAELFTGEKKAPKGAETGEQYATALPIATAIAQSWNTAFAESCGGIVGDEMERFGVHIWLAPALNIHRNVLCGRNFEYFSEDPLISGLMAAAVTRGVQKHPGKAVTLKHYTANNQETNRFGSSSNLSERALREIYLKGFEIAVREAKPRCIMTSYNLINGVHVTERRDLCTDVLRREFGFDGAAMTDWWVGPITAGQGANAGRVAAAGVDLMMPGSKKDHEDMLAALASGNLTREQLETGASRVSRLARSLTKI